MNRMFRMVIALSDKTFIIDELLWYDVALPEPGCRMSISLCVKDQRGSGGAMLFI